MGCILSATISGGTTPVAANIGGTGAPITLDPIKLDVGLRFQPDMTIEFKLFGFIPIFSIRVGP
ncbi:MAG: hypothetical protein HY652_13405 [Acidobacteria bacterium]|nr:hypothetical protein [Acidobacteriota bacterium]